MTPIIRIFTIAAFMILTSSAAVHAISESKIQEYMAQSEELRSCDKALNAEWKSLRQSTPKNEFKARLNEQREWVKSVRQKHMNLLIKCGYARNELQALIMAVKYRTDALVYQNYENTLSEEDIRRGNIKADGFFRKEEDCEFMDFLDDPSEERCRKSLQAR